MNSQNTRKPIAITVSTNFSDILPFSLTHNLDYFDHWYIITASDDQETTNIINSLNSKKITLLTYTFRYKKLNHFNNNYEEYFFDKGGALALCQKEAYEKFPDHWYLILDTDIIITDPKILCLEDLDPTKIYGPARRLDYLSMSDYKIRNAYYTRKMSFEDNIIIGFFQLYKKQKFYRSWPDSNYVDVQFANRWPKERRCLLNFDVDHLGAKTTNDCTYKGRPLGVGFRIDT